MTRSSWLVRATIAFAGCLPSVALAEPSVSVRAASEGVSLSAQGATVDLGRCLTDRVLDPAGLRPWSGCPSGLPRPVSVVPQSTATPSAATHDSPLPQCVAVPGVNDRCEQWGTRFTQAVHGVVGMVINRSGDRVYVAGNGSRPDNGVAGIVLASFTTAGKPGWVLRAPTTLPTTATAIAISSDGRQLFVTGYITLRPNIDSLPFDFFYTLGVDALTGRVVWVAQYPGIGANNNRALAVTAASNGTAVFVTGVSERPCSSCQVLPSDWATVSIDARTGRPRWVVRYSGLRGGQNAAISLAVSPNGRQLVVTGVSERPTLQATRMYDFATASYRVTDGAEQWVRRYSSGAVDIPVVVLIAPHGEAIYVAGTGADSGPGGASYANYTVVAYSTVGVPRWQATYRDVGGTNNVMTAGILSRRGDRIIITGQGEQSGSRLPSQANLLTVAQSTVAFGTSNGKRAWASSFAPNAEPAVGTTLTRCPGSDRVYVGGVLGMPTPLVGLVGYTVTTSYAVASGALQWTARYDLRDPASVGSTAPAALVCNPRSATVYLAAQASAMVSGAGQNPPESLVLGYAQ